MFDEKKKRIIIVCDKKTKVYATALTQLITEKDDTDDGIIGSKDSTVEATIWDEKIYLDTEHNLSTEQLVLFIGKTKASKDAISGLQGKETFNQHGIKFYKGGNHSAIVVENRLLAKEEYNEFLKFCAFNQSKFEVNVDIDKLNFANNILELNKVLLHFIYPLAIHSFIAKAKAKKQIRDHQYREGIMYYYMNELSKFLEN